MRLRVERDNNIVRDEPLKNYGKLYILSIETKIQLNNSPLAYKSLTILFSTENEKKKLQLSKGSFWFWVLLWFGFCLPVCLFVFGLLMVFPCSLSSFSPLPQCTLSPTWVLASFS